MKETKIFIPPVSIAKVIKVYDGDTITVASRLPFTDERKDIIWRFSVRLNGIDCPEIRGMINVIPYLLKVEELWN